MSEPLTASEKRRLHDLIATHCAEVESMFKPGLMKITLIARNTQNPKGHLLVSIEDNIGDAVEAIHQLMDQTDATTFFPPHET